MRRDSCRSLPAVAALFAEMDGERPLPMAQADHIYTEMSRYPSYSCYLAVIDGQPVGTFTLLVFVSLVHDGAPEAVIDGVVVSPSWRGRGVGTALMVEAMRIAQEEGCYKLMLSS